MHSHKRLLVGFMLLICMQSALYSNAFFLSQEIFCPVSNWLNMSLSFRYSCH